MRVLLVVRDLMWTRQVKVWVVLFWALTLVQRAYILTMQRSVVL